MENKYYEPALDLDGTADELFVQARNGYIDDPVALDYLVEILNREGKAESAQYVGFIAEREREDDPQSYSLAQMKIDAADGLFELADDVSLREDGSLKLSVAHDARTETIQITLVETQDNGKEYIGVNTISTGDFYGMTGDQFNHQIGETLNYGMQEQGLGRGR